MNNDSNRDKPIKCESILHCKATVTLKAAIKAELEEEDKPLEEILQHAKDQE
jgi:hypothetical protein